MLRKVGYWMALGLPAFGVAGCSSDASVDQVAVQALPLTDAKIALIAIGKLAASAGDLSNETSGELENGAPGNLLGGVGSGLAHLRGHTFLSIPDRGPNAEEYNATLDNTTSYIPRFHTLKLELKKNTDAEAKLPFQLEPQLEQTTLLWSDEALVYGTGDDYGVGDGAPELNQDDKFYFSGRSDNFAADKLSTNADNARLDPENIRVSNDGKYVYIADEYGPYVYKFDRRSGKRERVITLPDAFAVKTLSAQGDPEIEQNESGRVANKGAEGLAITPDGKTLIVALQSPLIQDGGAKGRYLRLVAIDLDTEHSKQYAYPLASIGTDDKPKYSTVSEITAINGHELLVDERDGAGLGDDSEAELKKIYKIDLSEGSDVSAVSGEEKLAEHALDKTLVLDFVQQLRDYGLRAEDIPAKIEGLSFGPDVKIDDVVKHTLFISNDNDFLAEISDESHPDGIDNPNQFFVFAVDVELLDFEAQKVSGSAGKGHDPDDDD